MNFFNELSISCLFFCCCCCCLFLLLLNPFSFKPLKCIFQVVHQGLFHRIVYVFYHLRWSVNFSIKHQLHLRPVCLSVPLFVYFRMVFRFLTVRNKQRYKFVSHGRCFPGWHVLLLDTVNTLIYSDKIKVLTNGIICLCTKNNKVSIGISVHN